jgi:hypothetical protein
MLALLLTVVTSFASSTNSFANDAHSFVKDNNVTNSASVAPSADGITRQISTSFHQDFRNARLISSDVNNNFTKLTFSINDMVLFAFYTDNGKLLAVVRNILSSQLPLELMMDLKKNYSDYWITELFELNGDGQNCYYVSLENADTKLILRSTSDNTWEVYQQTDKN